MTNEEIENYLVERNFEVKAEDCIYDIFNTSPQITDSYYAHDTSMMTVITPDQSFSFKYILKKY